MRLKNKKSLSRTEVMNAIRKGDLSGDLVPGQRLVEIELSESLGTNRSVIHSALMDLVHEGLLEHIPNRGARVRIVMLQEALQITEVRMAVESLCVARAAEKITEREIEKFRAIGDEMARCAQQGNPVAYAELTHRLFLGYVKVADLPVAEEILLRLRDRIGRHRFRLSFRTNRALVSLLYWQALIEAICRHNPEEARLALREHTENVQEATLAVG